MSEEQAVEASEVEVTYIPSAETEAQNPAPSENAEEQAPQQEEEATKPEETEEQRKSKFQRRIDRKNREIAEARTEARLLKERLERLEAQQMQRPQEPGAPKLEQFDNFDDYLAARTAYEAEKIVNQRLTAQQREEQAIRAQYEQQLAVKTWQERTHKAAEKYPDFEDLVAESDAPITSDMGRAIIESEHGPDIAYYLAQHPEEADRIAQLSPIRQIAEIGKLEIKVSAPRQKKSTDAPPPITPVGSKAKAEKDPTEMTLDEFAKWRKTFIARR